jgi:DNA-binding CsgD family transcriptional regulator
MPEHRPLLSDRERQVLLMVGRGSDLAEIAAALGISASTVRHHLGHVRTKLGAHNQVQCVVRALIAGEITLADLEEGQR